MKKELFYIGLGKMGMNMAERLAQKRWYVIGYDPSESTREEAYQRGIEVVKTIPDGVRKLSQDVRVFWIMVPHTKVDEVLYELSDMLQAKDIVIDGGNSPFQESLRRHKELKEKGVHYLDAGVSGGPGGANQGACVMIGGERDIFEEHEELFRDISAPDAYQFLGSAGAGHFVKMIHNGIEYGMMQAIAEGFTLLKESSFDLNLVEVAKLYNQQSVIESRLVGWLQSGLERYGESLDEISGEVAQSGEGQWTVDFARQLDIRVGNIEQALEFRKASQGNPSYTGKLLSTMRNMFGGHSVEKEKTQNTQE